MLAGHAPLQEIPSILSRWCGDRETLACAAELYWSAAYHVPDWPPPFRDRHERLLPLLFSRGPIRQTVSEIDDLEARRLADELVEFARAAAAAPDGGS